MGPGLQIPTLAPGKHLTYKQGCMSNWHVWSIKGSLPIHVYVAGALLVHGIFMVVCVVAYA